MNNAYPNHYTNIMTRYGKKVQDKLKTNKTNKQNLKSHKHITVYISVSHTLITVVKSELQDSQNQQ